MLPSTAPTRHSTWALAQCQSPNQYAGSTCLHPLAPILCLALQAASCWTCQQWMKCHPKLLQALTLHKPALHWHHRHSICQPLLIFTVSWSQAAHLTMWPWPSSAGVVLRAEGWPGAASGQLRCRSGRCCLAWLLGPRCPRDLCLCWHRCSMHPAQASRPDCTQNAEA